MFKIDRGELIVSKDVKSIGSEIKNAILNYKIKKLSFEDGSLLYRLDLSDSEVYKEIVEIDLTNCKNLTIIDDNAFTKCENLVSVNLKDLPSLTTISNNAFSGCKKLKNVNFSGCKCLRDIKENAFANCNNLEVANFNNCDKIKIIGNKCFNNCAKLKELDLSNKDIMLIGKNALDGCKSINEINLSGQQVKVIGTNAFANMDNLRYVDLSNCKNLESFCDITTKNDKCKHVLDLRGSSVNIVRDFSANDLRLNYNEQMVHSKNANSFADCLNENFNVNIYDKNGKIYSIDSKSLNRDLNLFSSNLYVYCEKTGKKLPNNVLNAMQSINELKFVLKNIDNFKFCFDDAKHYLVNPYFKILRIFGLFDFDKTTFNKNDIISFKNILAKDLVNHKIINDLKSETNKKYIDELIQQKSNKIARTFSFENLCIQFVKNNIYNNQFRDKLFNQIEKFELNGKTNLKFAQFFVINFDDLIKIPDYKIDESKELKDSVSSTMQLYQIYRDFDDLLSKSNKMVVTRSNSQRFTAKDCNCLVKYDGVESDTYELASLCSEENLNQVTFENLQHFFKLGKANKDKQVLKIVADNDKSDIKYEFIEKDNPIGLLLGYKTVCCQTYDKSGHTSMVFGATNENGGFITINYKGKIIGQAFCWYNPKNKVVVLDNIEIPQINHKLVNDIKSVEVLNCINRVCKNIYTTMNNNGHAVDDVVIGKHRTPINSLNKNYNIVFDKKYDCPYNVYTDINKSGQIVVIKDGEFKNINTYEK